MFLSVNKGRAGMKQGLIDVREAFALWDMLRSKYSAIEHLKTLDNNAHDLDLKILLKSFIKSLHGYIKKFEDELQKYSIQAPDRNRTYIKSPSNSMEVTDEFIAGELLIFVQEETRNC